MTVEFSNDTAEMDKEMAMLEELKANVMSGWLEVGRDDEHRLVFRITDSGRKRVESMGT